jgi:hypothetical protein
VVLDNWAFDRDANEEKGTLHLDVQVGHVSCDALSLLGSRPFATETVKPSLGYFQGGGGRDKRKQINERRIIMEGITTGAIYHA